MTNQIAFTFAIAFALAACGAPAEPAEGDAPEPLQCGWPAVVDVEVPEYAPCYTVRVNEPELAVVDDSPWGGTLCGRQLSYDGGACYLNGCHELIDVPAGTLLRVWGTPTVPNCTLTLIPQEACQ